MPGNYDPVFVIGMSIGGICWTIVTLILIADKGWGKGIAISVGGTLALIAFLLLYGLLMEVTGQVFGSVGALIAFALFVYWGCRK